MPQPNYTFVRNIITTQYSIEISWEQQIEIIKKICEELDSEDIFAHRKELGKEIKEGLIQKYNNSGIIYNNSRISALKETAIIKMEKYYGTSEYYMRLNI